MKKIFLLLCFCGLIFAMNTKNDAFFRDVNTTCPVKFIDVFKYPKWIAVLEYSDNEKLLFSSVKAMLHYFYTQNHTNISALKKMYVTDYKNGDLIDASVAYYVFGSRIMSVSGDDLIPFKSADDAKAFAKENSGHKILTFHQITKKLIDYLN